MPRLIWSRAALFDTQRLYRFLAEKNPDAAKRAIALIRAQAKALALHPEMGRSIEDMEPEYRELVIEFGSSGYVCMYRFENELITILAIRHQREAGY
jgi:plasmid stabilization system protein ParE